jgi:hypothetical protein
MEWAEEAPTTSVYERVILLMLAYRAKPDGTEAWPGRPRMARTANCDVKTIDRHLAALQRRGVIKRGNQAVVAHLSPASRPVVYDLQIPYDWYSAAQLKRVNEDRVERGLGPLERAQRPNLKAAPARKSRRDKGVPRPKRRRRPDPVHDQPGHTDHGLTVPPMDNADTPDFQSGQRGLSVPEDGTDSPVARDSESPKPPGDQPGLDPEDQPPPPLEANADARDVAGHANGGGGSSTEAQPTASARLLQATFERVANRFAPPPPDVKRELVNLVDQLWQVGATNAQIDQQLTANLAGVHDLGRVWVTRLTRLGTQLRDDSARPAASLPPPCGKCEGRPDEGKHTRVIYLDDDTPLRCPDCHPDVARPAPPTFSTPAS